MYGMHLPLIALFCGFKGRSELATLIFAAEPSPARQKSSV